MKRIFFIISLIIAYALPALAQENEPEFVGEVNIINGDQVIPLDKEYTQIKTKAGASVYLTGIGSVKSKINVAGPMADARAPKSDDFVLIVRAVDNQSDPMAVVNIFKFEKTAKARKAELSSLNTFGGQNDNKLNYVEFTAKKYGEASYVITLKEKKPGEYGVIVKNPNTKDEKSTIVACFGIE